MTNTWLIRRPVRRPVSRATTAPISSSVCRLPFIRISARRSRTSATACAAAAWLCGASTIRSCPGRSRAPGPLRRSWLPARRGSARSAPGGRIDRRRPAPTLRTDARPRSRIGSRPRHRRSSCSYFPVPGSVGMTRSTGSVDASIAVRRRPLPLGALSVPQRCAREPRGRRLAGLRRRGRRSRHAVSRSKG